MNTPLTLPLTDALAQGLHQLGCRTAFGVSGAAIGRFIGAASRAGLQIIHPRHESGAGFMAAEHSLITDAPAAVFTTSGPGLSNALTGLVAAAWEGARIIAVIGGTARDRASRIPFQQTGPEQLDLSAWLPPGLAHRRIILGQETGLPEALGELAEGLASPGGFLGLVLLPTDQQQRSAGISPIPRPLPRPAPAAADVAACVRRLAGRRVACWVGHGARRCPEAIVSLVEQLGASVLVTPRGKGVFPEDHPALLGVTGLGGARGVRERVTWIRPEVTLVLGCRLSEFSSWWDPALVPPGGLIHVDPSPSEAAYPDATALSITAEVGPFVEALLAARVSATPCQRLPPLPDEPLAPTADGIHPAALMAAVQSEIVDATDAPVISEAGSAFAWASRTLRFPAPRYRVSPDFGAMGHASAGVVGMALARSGKAVALLGDGAMLMNTEINTAVQYRAQAVWVVLNDAAYGMIRHGMEAIGEPPVATGIPRVDFVAFARAQGAEGIAVDCLDDLPQALRRAMAAEGPVVVDVRIDPDVPPPFGARNTNLKRTEEAATWRG